MSNYIVLKDTNIDASGIPIREGTVISSSDARYAQLVAVKAPLALDTGDLSDRAAIVRAKRVNCGQSTASNPTMPEIADYSS